MSGSDPFPFDENPVFAEPWEAHAFALVIELHKLGRFTWNEWADMLSTVIKEDDSVPYYQSWLAALERISQENGLVNHVEHVERTKAWEAAEAATPHGEPIQLERLASKR